MKKFSLFIFSLLCFLLVACKNDLFDKGYIKIQLPEINTEVKSSRAAVSYNFTLTFTNSKNITITENGVSGETLTLILDADTYKIAGEVYNQDGVLYYAGETEAVVEIGVLTEVKLVLKKVYVEPETPEEKLPEEIPEETPEEELPEEIPEETPEEELPEEIPEETPENDAEEKPEEILKTDLIYFSWGTPNFERINYYSSRDEKKVLLEKEQQGFISCMVVVIDDAPIEVAVLSGSETYTDMSKLEFIDVKENPDSGIEEASVEILEESIAMLEDALTAMGDVEDTPDILNIKQLLEDEKSVVNLVNTLTAAGENVKLYAFRIEPANVKEVDGYTFVIKNYERLESDESVVAKDTPIITDTYTFRDINCYLMSGDVKMLSDNYEEKGFIYSSEMFGEEMLFGLNFESDDNNLGEFTHNLYYKDITDKGYKIYVNGSEYSKNKLEDIQTYIGSVPVVMATGNGTVLVDDRVNVIPDFVKVGLAGTTSNEFDEDNMVYDEYCVSSLKVNTSDAKGKSLAVGLRNPDQIYNYCVEGGSKNYEALGLFDGLYYIWTVTSLDGDAAERMKFENIPVDMSSISEFSDLYIVLEMKCIVEDDATPVTLFSNRMEFELRIIDDFESTGGTGGTGSAGGTGSSGTEIIQTEVLDFECSSTELKSKLENLSASTTVPKTITVHITDANLSSNSLKDLEIGLQKNFAYKLDLSKCTGIAYLSSGIIPTSVPIETLTIPSSVKYIDNISLNNCKSLQLASSEDKWLIRANSKYYYFSGSYIKNIESGSSYYKLSDTTINGNINSATEYGIYTSIVRNNILTPIISDSYDTTAPIVFYISFSYTHTGSEITPETSYSKDIVLVPTSESYKVEGPLLKGVNEYIASKYDDTNQ